jgi:glutathione S-transferase
MNMRFYMVPGSCSTGIHILLEELDKLFEAHIINIPKGENQQKDYLAINPKGTIPTLVLENGTVLTEFQSIAYYLAMSNPDSNLLPNDPLAQAKTLETMAFVVNTIHGQGFARIFATDSFMANGCDADAIKEEGMKIVDNGFQIINQELIAREKSESQFSIADAALFYIEFWADKLNIPLPEHCQLHYDKVNARPVVKRVLMEEGYH